MGNMRNNWFLIFASLVACLLCSLPHTLSASPPLFYWNGSHDNNFGDMISKDLVARIVGKPIPSAPARQQIPGQAFLALGSIIHEARTGDVVWGSGFRVKTTYDTYSNLDVRAVRGPITRLLLLNKGIPCPEIYGDPGLLVPLFFPEFQREEPLYEYIVIPHFYQVSCFRDEPNLVSPSQDWRVVLHYILRSKLVISSSLHGIILAEAFGVPARLFRHPVLCSEPLMKFYDYFMATGRPNYKFAHSIKEALEIGGAPPIDIDLTPLLNSFPYDLFKE